jgi:hypothetical protein
LCQKINHFARCCRSTNRNIKPDNSVNSVKAGNTMQRQQQYTTRANKIEQGNQHPVGSSSDDEYIASSAGLSMGFSLRMGFGKKISGREACHKSNKIDVSQILVAVLRYPTP